MGSVISYFCNLARGRNHIDLPIFDSYCDMLFHVTCCSMFNVENNKIYDVWVLQYRRFTTRWQYERSMSLDLPGSSQRAVCERDYAYRCI